MRDASCFNCRPGLSQVPSSVFRVPSWPKTRNPELETRNRICWAFLFACGTACMRRDANCTNSHELNSCQSVQFVSPGVPRFPRVLKWQGNVPIAKRRTAELPLFAFCCSCSFGVEAGRAGKGRRTGFLCQRIKPDQTKSNHIMPDHRWIKPARAGGRGDDLRPPVQGRPLTPALSPDGGEGSRLCSKVRSARRWPLRSLSTPALWTSNCRTCGAKVWFNSIVE